MTNREKLQENYEDSVLALLMDEFAEIEGKQYIEENERLRKNPDAVMPEEIEKRALHYIDQRFSRINRKNHGGKVLRFLGRLAIAAVIAVLLFGAAFALSETVRAGTLNFLMQIDERIATWQFAEEDSGDSNADNSIELIVEWLPDGYYPEDPLTITPHDIVLDCTNEAGGLIRISVHESEDYIYTLDLENADYYTEITIQDCEGIIIKKNDIIRIDWHYHNAEMVVIVESADEGEETLLHVAENVTLVR